MSTPVTATPQTVPDGVCPQTIQEIVNTVSAYTVYEVPGDYNSYVVSAATPDPEDQNKLWQKLDGSGNPDRIYYFNSGSWLSLHNTPTGFIQLYMGAVTGIDTFDGGSAGAVTATTGPMWEVVSEAVGRTAVHPDPGGSVLTVDQPAVGDTFGEERHTMTVDELVAHSHPIKIWGAGTGGGISIGDEPDTPGTDATEEVGSSQPFNVVQPSIAIYYIRRTARLFYVG